MRSTSKTLTKARIEAEKAQRALENGVALADVLWIDTTRRAFESGHLLAIRADAKKLTTELVAIEGLASSVEASLRAADKDLRHR